MDDIAGKASEAKRHLATKKQKSADDQQEAAEKQQNAAEFAERVHARSIKQSQRGSNGRPENRRFARERKEG